MITATRYHEIDCGHRVVGQGGHCEHLHGHRYTIHFTCEADELNAIGMVIDFGVMKARLCQWLEDHWDHRLLLWEEDPFRPAIEAVSPESVVVVPFNPTAENLAEHLLTVVGPAQLAGTGVALIRCTVEETRKCSATAELDQC
jgi:6-pyruvoyltetrahydropterin/6-carboxytetrahydropterin synthase